METPNIIQETKRLFLLLLCVLACCHIARAEMSQEDKEILLELYHSTNGPEWIKKWDLNQAPSSWYGIKVVKGKVIAITLFHNNLSGMLPSSIGKLKDLKQLNLAFNRLTGELPKEIAALTKLRILKLEMNRLKGSLPDNIGDLKELVELSIFNNFISGSIPSTIGNMKQLEILNLSSNSFKGEIPKSIGALSKLESLGLFENRLEGSIPHELGNLVKLKEMVLANNQLGGEIPQEFGQLASLEIFQIQNNNFNSFKNLEKMDSRRFLVFDYDKHKAKRDFKKIDFNRTRTRMADTKFEDVEDDN